MTLDVRLHKAQVICVFVHGRGQSPEAMKDGVNRPLSTPGVAYVLPRAPGAVGMPPAPWMRRRQTAAQGCTSR